MIPSSEHLLPASYTPLEKALAAVSTRSEAIPFPIREIWDPWACPPDFLKVLAHAFSVDLWNDGWTEQRKRSIIANAVKMHREKGTLAAVYDYLRYVDATLEDYLVPPQRVFSGPTLTRAEREAWLSGLPQVRTWRIMERGTAGRAIFAGGFLYKSFLFGKFPLPSTAIDRLKRRVRWVVDGIETETRVSQFESYFRLHVRSSEGTKVFCNRIRPAMFFQKSDARERLVTIRPIDRLPWRSPVGPNLEPITAEPERVIVGGQTNRGVFSGRAVGDGFFRPSTAWQRIYNRYPVNDGRRVNRRPSIQFMGVGRYRFPAHTAHLKVSMPGKRSPFAAGDGIMMTRLRFWIPRDAERLRNVRRALQASKRASDKMLIRYADRPQIVAGQLFRAGIQSFVIGYPSQG